MDNNTSQNGNMTDAEKRRLEIYDLQMMLRKIAQVDGGLVVLNPDGIFGEETENVVKAFQRDHGLPATGVVDFATWTAIAAAYEEAMLEVSPCLSICPFPGPHYKTFSGEQSDLIYIIQIMLSAISVAYDRFEDITPCGVCNDKTCAAIREFQRLNNLPETGVVDRTTWDSLAQNYNTFSGNDLYIS